MTKLSVNINKVATLRNSRGKDKPNVVQTALDLVRFGAQGITVHPRPDGRHIRTQDVLDLSAHLDVELNIEGYPSDDFLRLIEKVRPAQCTLVPDPPDVLTSNAGWNVSRNQEIIRATAQQLKAWRVRSSFFIDPHNVDEAGLAYLKSVEADRIELYTESYAELYLQSPERAVAPYQKTAALAARAGLGLNAGHDLNQHNLQYFAQHVEGLLEVSIGHALVAEALYDGWQTTIKRYLECLL
jgi:pyridoxine 5-phosphate synthase